MDRLLHVVALSPDLTRTLIYRTAGGWLLPWLDLDGQRSVFPRLQAQLAPLVGAGDLLHTAVIPPQRQDDVPQGYCTALVTERTRSVDVEMLQHDELEARPAVMPRQLVAVRMALSRFRAPVAPFDTPERISEARSWARGEVSRNVGQVLSTAYLRCTRYDYIVRYDTNRGSAYFKGGPERVADEAETTRRLWELSPDHFPQTLSIDLDAGRWLYRELQGEPIVERLTIATAAEAVRTLAKLQKQALDHASLRHHLATSCLTAVELFTSADKLVEQTWQNGELDAADRDGVLDRWTGQRTRMLSTCHTIDELKLPQTFVITDFWPGNVLATPKGIGFIDLGQSYWSYPFMALSRFIKQVEHKLQARGAARAAIEDAFVAEWADTVPSARMRLVLPHLSFFNRLFGVVLKSRRLARWELDLGHPLPGWYRARQLQDFVLASLDASS